MKKINFIVMLNMLIGMIFIQTGCKKSSDPPAPVPTPAGPLAVNIGGKALTFSGVIPSLQPYSVGPYSSHYFSAIGAVGSNGDYFVINIYYENIALNTPTDIATDNWDMGYKTGSTFMNAKKNLIGSGASGTLTLTKKDLLNKRMEGSFTGTMLDNQGVKIPVTGGSFAISY